MQVAEIEENVRKTIDEYDKGSFIYALLSAYGIPKASIKRLQSGDYNVLNEQNGILWKKKLFFKADTKEDLHSLIDSIKESKSVQKHNPRFIIVTDHLTLLAVDQLTADSLDIPLADLPKFYDFFLPLAGLEKVQLKGENPADVKAAEKLGKLYDLILRDNKPANEAEAHSLNVFLSRLLFCLFAEDTEIYKAKQFTYAVASHTDEDGSDLREYLERLFEVLNTEKRVALPKYLSEFPYVNGGLFKDAHRVPDFTEKSRSLIVECGSLNWANINPDIFGSMIQAVVHKEKRGDFGIHYTSVANIMKVLEPLFLGELRLALDEAGSTKKKLDALLARLYNLKIFDPACGSGNFLVIAYKELCKLEIEIFKRLHGQQTSFRFDGNIRIDQFYGIEIDDFAHETAKLSLWLAEHQMNLLYKEIFGYAKATLPLQATGNIVCANALKIKWDDVCASDADSEVIILGNPPYLGGKYQSKSQKAEMEFVFKGIKNFGELDYIAAWFFKASNYIVSANAKFGFVTTSSICQGSQVHQLWPHIYKLGLDIAFAHKPFAWANNARAKAGVTCSIIGVTRKSATKKSLYENGTSLEVKSISPYLTPGSPLIVHQRLKPLSDFPAMITGNSAYDGGNLLLTKEERATIVDQAPEATVLFRRINGSEDFLSGDERWCLWIANEQLDMALSIPAIAKRIKATRAFREAGGDVARGLAKRPHQFRYTHTARNSLIIVPRVSSMRRRYIPFGFLDSSFIVSDAAQAIYDPEPYIFGVISSRMHIVWVATVAGRLKTDYRYSSGLCYNTFPFPQVSANQKLAIEQAVFQIVDERERHSEKSLSEIYDPDEMPQGLLENHRFLDNLIEQCYRRTPFRSDEERVDYLFALYEKMTKTKEESNA